MSSTGRIRAEVDRARGVHHVLDLRQRLELLDGKLARFEEIFSTENHARLVENRQAGEELQGEVERIGARLDAIDRRLDAVIDEALRRSEAADADLNARLDALVALVDEIRGGPSD